MRALAGALLGVIATASAAFAAGGDACNVAAHLVQVDAPLARVAMAIAKTRTLTIAVAGTTSSSLPGAGGPAMAYPARLEISLRKRLPDVAIKLVSYARPRQTAADMVEQFPRMLKDDQPNLVIWQTGTTDAIKGVAPDIFQTTLEQGVDKLQSGGADVILMNMQFNPRTDAVVSTSAYADALRWVALERHVNLFDRQGIMRHWSEMGTFDLMAATKSLDTASQVHDCIGRLLADLVTQAVKAAETEAKESK
jgi:hypothetical protein